MTDSNEVTVYDALGEEGLARLVAAFYRQIPADDLLGPLYPPDDLAGAEQRLRDFLVYRFGGPDRYIQERGHPKLRIRHVGFAINRTVRDRWMQLMNAALDESGTPPAAATAIRKFLDEAATFLINAAESDEWLVASEDEERRMK
ncbi:globin [Planctellipticum variicoloris]|uniref:globin domain-containing protein n=1 Tax=Planctellipticum variicoloris TaxID=3064265 RepID=UPI003013D098|nr:globin [Planctomycetaceae bacterium SH412]